MEIIDEYKTITSTPAEGFYSEKRSKFYAFAHHVETEEQVKEIVQTYRKRFYDARHVCYAFMLGADSSLFCTSLSCKANRRFCAVSLYFASGKRSR